MNFTTLTQTALLGTSRGALPPPSGATPLDAMAAALDRSDPESAFLGMAALYALHEQAGQLPARDLQPAPAAAPQESMPHAGMMAAGHLAGFLSGENPELLPEWLRMCANAGRIVPPEMLPALLSFRPAAEELRALKLPVLGERGRWLAGFSPELSWVEGATAEDESAWETGEPPVRRALLRRVRERDTARARELLARTWNDDTPEDRSAFMATIGLNLQPEDEPFLTAALEDKRKEVRRAAFETLSRLPASDFARRMLARLDPLLTFTSAESGSLLKLKKAKPATLEAVLPAACDKPMQRDGVEPKPPRGTGEKTWWLQQMLQAVPLPAWEVKWRTSPAELIEAAQQTDSGRDVIMGWQAAARIQRNPVWAEAMLHAAPTVDPGELLAVLPATARERWYTAAFKSSSTDASLHLFQQLIAEPAGDPWSHDFSLLVLDRLRAISAGRLQPADYTLRSQLRCFALRLDPLTLPDAQKGWPTEPVEAWTFWQGGVEPMLQLCHLRHDMIQALGNPRSRTE